MKTVDRNWGPFCESGGDANMDRQQSYAEV